MSSACLSFTGPWTVKHVISQKMRESPVRDCFFLGQRRLSAVGDLLVEEMEEEERAGGQEGGIFRPVALALQRASPPAKSRQ